MEMSLRRRRWLPRTPVLNWAHPSVHGLTSLWVPTATNARALTGQPVTASGTVAHTLNVTLTSTWFTSTSPKTVTISWEAGDVIVLAAGIESNDDALSTPTATGLTFTLATSVTAGGAAEPGAYIWTATAAAAGASQVVSMARTGSAGAKYGFAATVVTGGSSGVGNVYADQAEAAGNLTVSAASSVLYVGVDQNQVNSDETPTTGSGTATERGENQDATWGFYVADWRATSAGTFAFGQSSYAGKKSAQAAVEIKGRVPTRVKTRYGGALSIPPQGKLTIPDPFLANRVVGSALLALRVPDPLTGQGFQFGSGVANNDLRWGASVPQVDGVVTFCVGLSTLSFAGWTHGNWDVWAFTNGPSYGSRIYADGQLQASGSEFLAAARTATGASWGVGQNGTATSNGNAGEVGLMASWDRELAPGEVASLTQDIFAMLVP